MKGETLKRRVARISMLPDHQRFKKTALKSRGLLKKAGKLLDSQLEYVEIPFEGTVLPGYYRKASQDGKKHKTLIMIGGGKTFTEVRTEPGVGKVLSGNWVASAAEVMPPFCRKTWWSG
jgi:hypothetical protein